MSRKIPALPFQRYVESLEGANFSDYSRRAKSRVRDRSAFEEQKAFLLDRSKTMQVVTSGRDSGGQVFDYVRRDEQPALRNGRLATPPIIASADDSQHKTGRPARFRKAIAADGNLTDLVPIRRPTLAELARFPTLSHCLRKHPMPAAAEGADPNHRYVRGLQCVPNSGGSAVLSVWRPAIDSSTDSFSLAQMWILAQGAMGAQTVEAGWHIYPFYTKTTQTLLFCGTTADGYASFSYNNLQPNFVQNSPSLAPGSVIDPVSTDGGTQVELTVSWKLSDGNWWLFVGSGDAAEPVGYYPPGAFNGGPLPNGASQIQFGGETASVTGTFPAMGSGEFAAAGSDRAAYQRNLIYYTMQGAVQDTQLVTDQNWPNDYTIAPFQDADWHNYFFFGGPGDT